MPFPINTVHRLALEDGTSLLLLEDNTSKVILDEAIALDDPLNAATVTTLTPGLTFVGENIAGNNLTYEVEVDTVNTFDSTPGISRIAAQDATGTGTGSATATYASTATSGNLLIAIVGDDSGSGIPALSGFSTAFNSATSGAQVTIFYKVSNGTEKIITCNYASAGALKVSIFEYSNNTSIPFDVANGTGDNTTPALTATGATISTTTANELIIAAGFFDTASVETYSTSTNSFSQRSSLSPLMVVDKIVSATGSYTTNITVTGSTATWVSVIASFKSNPPTPLLDKTSDLNTGFTDDATLNADDKLLLETGNSGGSLLLEDNSSHLIINYSYPQSDYMTYTVPSSTLSNSTTYYWRARQKVQNGGSYPVTWSEIRSFTISLSVGGAALSSTLLMMNVG